MNFYLKGLITGIVMYIVSWVVYTLFVAAFPDINAAYANPFFIPLAPVFFLNPVLLGFGLAWLWDKTKKSWKSGLEFGAIVGVATMVPLFFAYIGTFSFPAIISVAWTASEIVSMAAGGFVLGQIKK